MSQTVQTARPVSDDLTGNWGPTPVYPHVNGLLPNDLTPAFSGSSPQADRFEVKLAGLAWPSAGPQVLSVRLAGDGATPATVVLLQGSTVIAAARFTPPATFQTYALTLSAAQAALISNYADLHVEVLAGDPVVDCCPNPVPALLYATVSNPTGPCTCMPGTFSLLWDSNSPTWRPDGTIDPTCFHMGSLACLGGTPYFGVSADAGWSCAPVHWVFDLNTCCGIPLGGTVTVTVTQ
jgi:hypothetical protein